MSIFVVLFLWVRYNYFMTSHEIEEEYVFVYGTLMDKGRNADILKQAEKDGEAQLINAQAITEGANLSMQQYESSTNPGQYTPGVEKGGNYHIQGELWLLAQSPFRSLDQLEEFNPHRPPEDNKYNREKIQIKNHKPLCWIFLINTVLKEPIPKPHNRVVTQGNIQSWDARELNVSG